MAGAPRSVPLYPAAKVRTRSKGEANRVAKNSKAHRASGVALCTTAEGKPKRLYSRGFGFKKLPLPLHSSKVKAQTAAAKPNDGNPLCLPPRATKWLYLQQKGVFKVNFLLFRQKKLWNVKIPCRPMVNLSVSTFLADRISTGSLTLDTFKELKKFG